MWTSCVSLRARQPSSTAATLAELLPPSLRPSSVRPSVPPSLCPSFRPSLPRRSSSKRAHISREEINSRRLAASGGTDAEGGRERGRDSGGRRRCGIPRVNCQSGPPRLCGGTWRNCTNITRQRRHLLSVFNVPKSRFCCWNPLI